MHGDTWWCGLGWHRRWWVRRSRVESTHVVRTANQSSITCKGSTVQYTGKHICKEQKRISESSHGVRWQNKQPQGPVHRPWNISALWFHAGLGFIDFRLNGWCRCSAQTTALFCRCNILQSNKHQPGCQHEQLLLFKAVTFKGDELEWRGWYNQAGGLDMGKMFYKLSGEWVEFICFIYLI